MSDDYDQAMAEMGSQFGGGDDVRRDHRRFDGKGGNYVSSKAKDDPNPAEREFKLHGVILCAVPTQTLWPSKNPATGKNAFGFDTTQRLCVSRNSNNSPGSVFANAEVIDNDYAVAARLQELGWKGPANGGCADCGLRQYDEARKQSACRPGYDVAMILVDPKTQKPLDDAMITIVHFVSATSYNGVRIAMRKVTGSKKRPIDSLITLRVEDYGQTKSPCLTVDGVTPPALREHCQAMGAIAWESMKRGRSPFGQTKAEAGAPSAVDAADFDDSDIPF